MSTVLSSTSNSEVTYQLYSVLNLFSPDKPVWKRHPQGADVGQSSSQGIHRRFVEQVAGKGHIDEAALLAAIRKYSSGCSKNPIVSKEVTVAVVHDDVVRVKDRLYASRLLDSPAPDYISTLWRPDQPFPVSLNRFAHHPQSADATIANLHTLCIYASHILLNLS